MIVALAPSEVVEIALLVVLPYLAIRYRKPRVEQETVAVSVKWRRGAVRHAE